MTDLIEIQFILLTFFSIVIHLLVTSFSILEDYMSILVTQSLMRKIVEVACIKHLGYSA